MSSFWSIDGEDIRDKVDRDTPLPDTGGFELFPNNTKVEALITSAGIDEDKDGNRRVSVVMEVTKPEGYANRKLFPRFWVYDNSPYWGADEVKKKKGAQIERFTKLDASCGGKLARKDGPPSSDDISLAFTGKTVGVQIMLIEAKGDKDASNWYRDYFPKGSVELSEGPKAKARKAAPVDDIDDSDVPF